jgi:RNA polymerase sigma factor (sigma-70 family)
MSISGTVAAASAVAPSDTDLVEAVRDGEDAAFEELYRRYQPRVCAFVRGLLRDEGRAEDATQEAFLSAFRRIRVTNSHISFKPWIYEIARNAAIDSYRRGRRAEEVSIDAHELLRPADRRRLLGGGDTDAALIAKERLERLKGALDELSDTHHRVLVMRELEGRSYQEIGERLDLTRPAVESMLFRARRRLEREYEELDTGRRCQSMRAVIARLAEGVESESDVRRLGRHALRCSGCRRRARELGVEPIVRPSFGPARDRLAAAGRRAAALLPLPAFVRRPDAAEAAFGAAGAHAAAPLWDKGIALVVAAAFAGASAGVLTGQSAPNDTDPQVGAPASSLSGAASGAGERDEIGIAARTEPGDRSPARRGASTERANQRPGATEPPGSPSTGPSVPESAPGVPGEGGGGSAPPRPRSRSRSLDSLPPASSPDGAGSQPAKPDLRSAPQLPKPPARTPAPASVPNAGASLPPVDLIPAPSSLL